MTSLFSATQWENARDDSKDWVILVYNQICGQHGRKHCADGFGAKIGTVLFSIVENSRQLRRNPGITSGAKESLSKFTSMRMTLFF